MSESEVAGAAAFTIRELKDALAAKEAELASESAWAKQYLNELEAKEAECERLWVIEAAAQRVDILLWDAALSSFPDHRAAIAELSDALATAQPNGAAHDCQNCECVLECAETDHTRCWKEDAVQPDGAKEDDASAVAWTEWATKPSSTKVY